MPNRSSDSEFQPIPPFYRAARPGRSSPRHALKNTAEGKQNYNMMVPPVAHIGPTGEYAVYEQRLWALGISQPEVWTSH